MVSNNDGACVYCFDTSAFVDSWRRYYPVGIFPTLWDKLGELVGEDRIIVPREAEKEILNGNDDLTIWFKKSNRCVRPYTLAQLQTVQEIVNKYPKVSQFNKPKPLNADPFIVALAKEASAIVVTFEGNGNLDDPKIPFLCKENKVACFNMIGFFQNEGLSFRHGA